MCSPWKKVTDFDPTAEYLVPAPAIPTKSLRSTWRMFCGASAYVGNSPPFSPGTDCCGAVTETPDAARAAEDARAIIQRNAAKQLLADLEAAADR